MHDVMFKGNSLDSYAQREITNVLFDTNNNGIFTVSGFIKDILDRSDGESKLSDIIAIIKDRYQMTREDAESKSKNTLQELIEKRIITAQYVSN